jgi:hypothetical protein
MSQLSSLNLILNLSIVKGSKCQNCVKFKQTRKPHKAACQNCVQSKQPRKPHKAAEERHLAPLELRHSDICEMNGVLTGSG